MTIKTISKLAHLSFGVAACALITVPAVAQEIEEPSTIETPTEEEGGEKKARQGCYHRFAFCAVMSIHQLHRSKF